MKKILISLLVVLLALSACVSVGAVDTDVSLEQKFYDYCVEVLPEDKMPSEGDNVSILMSFETEGVELFLGFCEWIEVEKKDVYKTIGDWRVYSGYSNSPYDLGAFVASGDEIFTLEEAYEKGAVTDLSPLSYQIGASYITCVKVKDEYKYADMVLPMFLSDNASDWAIYVNYYEGYEYFTPDNTATGDEATPDYVLLTIYTNVTNNMITAEIYGNYILRGNNCSMMPYTFGKCVYVPAENKLYSIGGAYYAEIEGIEKIFTETSLGELIGDMDGDRQLTVKDATYIQKCLAGIMEFGDDDYIDAFILNIKTSISYISDFNRDGKRDVRDATAIQKHIAGLDY